MLEPLVLVYVGEPRRGLAVVKILDQRLQRAVHVVTAEGSELESLLASGDPDGVISGISLEGPQLQEAVNALAHHQEAIPLFDLTGSIAAVPDEVDVHYLSPDKNPEEAANELAGTLLDTALSDDERDSLSRHPGGYFAVDSEWRIQEWDRELQDWTGLDASDVVGDKLFDVLPEWQGTDFSRTCTEAIDTREPQTKQFFHKPLARTLDVRVVPLDDRGFECFLRDISDLGGDGSIATDRFEETLDRITDAFFALDEENRFVFLNSKAESILEVSSEDVLGVRFWDSFPAAISTSFYDEFTEAMRSQEPTSFEGYYRPSDSWLEVNAYPSEDGLSVFLKDVTEQVELQEKLTRLHEITRELIVAESDTEVASETVGAAQEVLDFPMVAVWRHDPTTAQLTPLAWSESIDDEHMEPLGPESEFIWEVFETGEHRHLGFVPATTATSHHPGKVSSELLVPIGDYGVLGAYSRERDAFDTTDIELFRILASTVESAFARTRRERQLARRNERLNDFASIVSHDLRNPLSVASAHAELARESEADDEHVEKIIDSLYRMEELIDDLLARARGDQELEREALELEAIATTAWENVETPDATLCLEGNAELTADPDRLVQLLENLYRNAIEHGNSTEEVSVGPTDDGFYVADDGRGIPPEKRDEIFERGVTHDSGGTGYGLAIVTDIVEGHGWTIDVTESESSGARFQISDVPTLANAELPE